MSILIICIFLKLTRQLFKSVLSKLKILTGKFSADSRFTEEIVRIENFKDIISFDSKDINEHMKFMAKLFEDKKETFYSIGVLKEDIDKILSLQLNEIDLLNVNWNSFIQNLNNICSTIRASTEIQKDALSKAVADHLEHRILMPINKNLKVIIGKIDDLKENVRLLNEGINLI
jgi:hypothetical protein